MLLGSGNRLDARVTSVSGTSSLTSVEQRSNDNRSGKCSRFSIRNKNQRCTDPFQLTHLTAAQSINEEGKRKSCFRTRCLHDDVSKRFEGKRNVCEMIDPVFLRYLINVINSFFAQLICILHNQRDSLDIIRIDELWKCSSSFDNQQKNLVDTYADNCPMCSLSESNPFHQWSKDSSSTNWTVFFFCYLWTNDFHQLCRCIWWTSLERRGESAGFRSGLKWKSGDAMTSLSLSPLVYPKTPIRVRCKVFPSAADLKFDQNRDGQKSALRQSCTDPWGDEITMSMENHFLFTIIIIMIKY